MIYDQWKEGIGNYQIVHCPDCDSSMSLKEAMVHGWHIDLDDKLCQCHPCFTVRTWFRDQHNAKAAEMGRAYIARMSKSAGTTG